MVLLDTMISLVTLLIWKASNLPLNILELSLYYLLLIHQRIPQIWVLLKEVSIFMMYYRVSLASVNYRAVKLHHSKVSNTVTGISELLDCELWCK